MSQTVTDHRSPAPPPRPATVTVAAALQFALVGTLLLAVATATAEAIRYDALIDRAARTVAARVSAGDVAFERSMNLSGTLVFAVSALVLAVWLGVTAVWLRRGSNVARILSLVGLGAPLVLGLLACVFGGVMGVLAVGMLVASPPEGFDDEGPFAEDDFDDEGPVPGEDFAGEALSDELARLDTGGWSIAFEVTGMTTTVLALLLGIATGILLLTGASRRYFRPRQAAPAFPHPYPPPAPWPPPAYPAPYWYGGPPPPVYPPPPAYPPPPVYPPPVYPPPAYPPPRAHPPAPPPD